MGTPFLESVHVDHFGAWHDKNIGPFGRHLNIVFGRNEAGKTTFASFVKGVLFGWERASKDRSNYKPDGAERSGKLIFADALEGDGGEKDAHGKRGHGQRGKGDARGKHGQRGKSGRGQRGKEGKRFVDEHSAAPDDSQDALVRTNAFLELSRTNNAEGPQGDLSLIKDIEKDTYSTIFSLTSDELMSLDNEDTVTSSLLTAGSGTSVSPAKVRDDLDDRIASFTSRSEKSPQSLTRLKQEESEIRAKIKQAEEKAKQYREDERKFQEIKPRREELIEQENDLSGKIDTLKQCRTNLKNVYAGIAAAEESIKNARDEEQNARQQQLDCKKKCTPVLEKLTDTDDRLLRSRIDEMADRKNVLQRMIDAARESSNNARAHYEALREMQGASPKDRDDGDADGVDGVGNVGNAEGNDSAGSAEGNVDAGSTGSTGNAGSTGSTGSAHPQRARRQMFRVLQVVILTVIFIVLLVFGILLFATGSDASSLSYMALGGVLIVIAIALAFAVLVLFLRSNRESKVDNEQLDQALQEALQEEKKLEAYEADMEKLELEITAELEEMGLAEAGSSPSLAREILENAKQMREEIEQAHKCEQQAANTIREASSTRDELMQQEADLRANAGISPDETIDDIDRKIAELEDRLRSAREESSGIDRQWGELSKELEQALQTHELDYLKNTEQDVRTQKAEATYDLARLILAQAMLKKAIDAWEEESQPEVYAQASRLLSLMTDGQWTHIARGDDGTFEVSDAFHNKRSVNKLSTGTRQQLYLAIRIALLMCADNVGRSIPVIADDILVNFDAQRRAGAAKALAELADTRQVIVLTCHEEVVDVLRDACESATMIDLN